jgi:large subunit ribosomal protein L28
MTFFALFNTQFIVYLCSILCIKHRKRSSTMAKRCQITGKTVLVGNNVSHANNRTKRRFLPNLQKKRIWVAEEQRWVTMKISTSALRTLDKKGYSAMMRDLNA